METKVIFKTTENVCGNQTRSQLTKPSSVTKNPQIQGSRVSSMIPIVNANKRKGKQLMNKTRLPKLTVSFFFPFFFKFL